MFRRNPIQVSATTLLLTGIVLMGQVGCNRIDSAQTRSGEIDVVGAQEEYNFIASEGDTVQVQATRSGGDLDVGVWLFDQEGGYLGGACGDQTANYTEYDLPMDGLYSLVVVDCAGTANTTGTYNISLMKIPGSVKHISDPDGGNIRSGQTRSGTIEPVGDMDGFNFSGLPGQTIQVQITRSGGNVDAGVWLFDPDGVYLGGACGDQTANYTEYDLPTDGLYTLVVVDCAGAANTTGTYNMSLTIIE